MAKLILIYLVALVGVMGILKLLVVLLEPRLTFFPVRSLDAIPRQNTTSAREFLISTIDQETVCGWLFQQHEPATEVLFFHGNSGNLFLWENFLSDIAAHSLTVFALDYRGYGKSSGSPTEEGLCRDTEAFVNHFWDELHVADQKVIYWGRSLGGPVASFASTVHVPDGLILEATFPSKSSLLRHYPLLRVMNVFSKYEFPTARYLKHFKRPILILHGENDSVVPFQEGQSLFDRLDGEKYFHPIPRANHNDLDSVDPRSYWERITRFIDSVAVPRQE